MTRNTPGKIPITECSSESQHLQKHGGPVVTIIACQADDNSLSHVYLESLCTCTMLLKQRQCDGKFNQNIFAHCQPLYSVVTHKTVKAVFYRMYNEAFLAAGVQETQWVTVNH